jgi:palmitoyl-protein thioesterase
VLTEGAYTKLVQEHLAQANYWHDPTDESGYRARCNFLPDVNNDGHINPVYRSNLQSVHRFVMVKFLNDTIVIPRESEWFGFYAPGQDTTVLSLQETALYTEDWLGLKAMDQAGKLVFLSTDGEHLQFTDQWFLENLLPFFNVTTAQWQR